MQLSRSRRDRAALVFLAFGAVFALRAVRADAPTGLYVADEDTVRDTRTGLTWERVPAAPPSLYPWAEATPRCTGLTLAGATDWRVPSVKELASIYDETRTAPAYVDPVFRTGANARLDSTWWTSTPVRGTAGSYWAVSFGPGAPGTNVVGVQPKNGTTYSLEVRCVRGP